MEDTDLAKAVEAVNAKMADAGAFGATVVFDFNDGSGVYVDGNAEPPAVKAADGEDPDCTISAAPDVFQELLAGDLDPTAAFMTGKIKIDGSMGAAMKVAGILG